MRLNLILVNLCEIGNGMKINKSLIFDFEKFHINVIDGQIYVTDRFSVTPLLLEKSSISFVVLTTSNYPFLGSYYV